jgi:hypothetical protein
MADDSTSISWESVYKISNRSAEALIFYVLLFGVAYLASRDLAMYSTKEQHQILCKSRKKLDGDPGND